jgi:hypothetical protein
MNNNFHPFIKLNGPQFSGAQPLGNNLQPAGFNTTPVNFSATTGGTDSVSFNSYFNAAPVKSVKDTPETVNVASIVNQVSVNGGTLNPEAMRFLQGSHPESAFVA